MSRKRCVVAVTENGGTRCGSTTAFTGSGGIPYLLMKWASDEDGNSLFDNMRLQTEISLEQYQGYLDHPENADDLSAMIEIDVHQKIIRVDEDMGQGRGYHEFPLEAFMERAEQFHSSFTSSGPNAIRQDLVYSVMKDLEGQPTEMTPVQPESGRRCTIDELLAQMEPQHQRDLDTTRQCIAGLTEYAAQLAAKHQEEQIPQLRKLCIDMAEFWGLAEDDTWEGFRKMEEQYGGAFDSAVSAARDSGYAPELSEQTMQDILDGLERYAQEMTLNGDLEQWAAECGALYEQLQAERQTEAQTNMEMGGM